MYGFFKVLIPVIFLLLSALKVGAQGISRVYFEPDEKFARYCVMFKNYTEGLTEYERLHERDTANVLFHYNIGICHLNLNRDKSKAIPWFEWVVKQPKYEHNAWYELGRAYLYTYRLDDAENAFKKYQQLNKGKEENELPVARYLEMVENARLLMKTPVNVSFQVLGPEINSKYPDYGAYCTSDESMLLFNSQRYGNTGNFMYYDGLYTSDIWISHYRNNKWKKARRFSPVINSALIEDIVSMSPDGSRIMLFFNNFIGENMLFYAQKKGRSYTRPEFTGPAVNTEYNQYGACLSPDNQTMFFSSDKPGGYGKKDIYFTRRLPGGEWGSAENLGDHVNTPYDEDMPYLAPDGTTLYICSRGHNSMGDYDIFKVTWDRVKNTFSKPENLGYPLNTAWDDKTISFSKSGRYAYISSNRGNGQGDLDIHRVIFHDVAPVYTIMKGSMLNADSVPLAKIHEQRKSEADSLNSILYAEAAKHYAKKDTVKGDLILKNLTLIDPELDAYIQVFDLEKNKLYGKYRPNSFTSNYLLILPPGKFRIVFSYSGFADFEISPLLIEDRDTRETSIIDYIFMDEMHTEKKQKHSRQELQEFYINE